MQYDVRIKRKVERDLRNYPHGIQILFGKLVEDLRDHGPLRHDWPNYSKLSEKKFHCHLAYKWVACWEWEKGTLIIEVYYAGSREKAPY